MLRISPNIITKEGIPCYNTYLNVRGKKIDLSEKWYDLGLKNKKLKINEMSVANNIAAGFYKFLNRKDNSNMLCYNFTDQVIHTPVHQTYRRWINTSELCLLNPFDKVEVFRIVSEKYEKSAHMCFYIGRHFNNTPDEEYLFLSKIGRMGIFVNNISQLLYIYDGVNTHLRRYQFLKNDK
jgi:hypothetical protein